jgi:hypothetical protein
MPKTHGLDLAVARPVLAALCSKGIFKMNSKFQQLVAASMKASLNEFVRVDSEIAKIELEAMEFCKGLIQRLNEEIPTEFANHEFYRWTKQKEDIHICWGIEKPISIQVDPLCEVIVALDSEFGSWSPEDNAVESFLSAYRNQDTESA